MKFTWLSVRDHSLEAKHCSCTSQTMRQSLSYSQISSCLPCPHHLHSFQFVFSFSILFISFFCKKKYRFFSLSFLSTQQAPRDFPKGFACIYALFSFQELRSKDPSRKVGNFVAPHYLNQLFFNGWCQSDCLFSFPLSVLSGASCRGHW